MSPACVGQGAPSFGVAGVWTLLHSTALPATVARLRVVQGARAGSGWTRCLSSCTRDPKKPPGAAQLLEAIPTSSPPARRQMPQAILTFLVWLWSGPPGVESRETQSVDQLSEVGGWSRSGCEECKDLTDKRGNLVSQCIRLSLKERSSFDDHYHLSYGEAGEQWLPALREPRTAAPPGATTEHLPNSRLTSFLEQQYPYLITYGCERQNR